MRYRWKQLMLEKIAGGGAGSTLFVPRLDIWYQYHVQRDTLPPQLKGLSLEEVSRSLGVGMHAVIPDYVHGRPVEDIVHRGLGWYNHPDFPYVIDFSDVDADVFQEADGGEDETGEDGELRVVYHTSRGDLTVRFEYGRRFLAGGSSIPAMKEHPIKGEEDYRKLAEVFSRIRIVERQSGYDRFRDRIGDEGLAVCCTTLAAGPVAHIMRDLRRMDSFFLDQYDFPSTMDMLAEVLAPLYDQLIEIAARSTAEVVIFGANYDDMITIEPLFRKSFQPWLNWAAEALHTRGKYLLTHTDGENRGLLDCYRDTAFDIADSVTPSPMTKLTLREYREALRDDVTIWGGIPSSIMLEEACSWEDFTGWVSAALKETAPYDRLIFSIADTCPPQADFDRIRYLCDHLNTEN